VAHVASFVIRGRRDVRLIGPQLDTEWTETAGMVHFLPADGRNYTLVTQSSAPCRSHLLLIPRRHLIDDGERADAAGLFGRLVTSDDGVLQSCLTRLATNGLANGAAADGTPGPAPDEAGRSLVRRLRQMNGRGDPHWHDDACVFDRPTLDRLVARIDGRLNDPPPPEDLALLCGLSPHHFVRKFGRSTGTSLHRFVNRRRIQAALAAMADPATPLARLAIDLGFASQSHLTRLFGEMTGMTPARCRRHVAGRGC
jgi:AraC-like DNA-binding protein